MYTPASFQEQQKRKDEEQLNLLAVFHFIMGGFMLLGVGFVLIHYLMMGQMTHMMSDPAFMKPPAGAPPMPAGATPPTAMFLQMMKIFIWVYSVLGVLSLFGCLANIASGVYLRRRECRTFSMVVAGVNCLMFPLGTILGIFTLMALLRGSVIEGYEAKLEGIR